MENKSTLKIDIDYPDFQTFYENSKDKVYRRTLSEFIEMHKMGSAERMFILCATIDGLPFDTKWILKLNDVHRLQNVLLPYFLRLEDYESCAEIKKILDSN